jgi:hypothetical protein
MTEPLLEYVSAPFQGRPAGYRLFPDGRVELCGGPGARDDRWNPTQTLTAEQVEAFVRVLDSTDLEGLEPRYEPQHAVRGVPSTAVWTLRTRGAVHRVEVVGSARVAVLEAIQQAFFDAQKVGVRAGAEVRVLRDGAEQTYELTCSPMECPGIDEVTKTLLMPHNHADPGVVRPDAERLLLIVWKENDVPRWEHVLTADGRLVRTLIPGGERKELWLSEDGMQRLGEALDRVDWVAVRQHCRTDDP